MNFSGVSSYESWRAQVDALVEVLVSRKVLLETYAAFLPSSERDDSRGGRETIKRIKDFLHQMPGGKNFIPGENWLNFVAVVGETQKRTGLDLGICPDLEANIDERMRVFYGEWDAQPSKNTLRYCAATDEYFEADLQQCLVPNRTNCPYRTLWQVTEADWERDRRDHRIENSKARIEAWKADPSNEERVLTERAEEGRIHVHGYGIKRKIFWKRGLKSNF